MAKIVLRRKSKNAEVKQHTMLTPHDAKKRIPGGLECPRNVNRSSKSTDGARASGSAKTENFFFSFGLSGLTGFGLSLINYFVLQSMKPE